RILPLVGALKIMAPVLRLRPYSWSLTSPMNSTWFPGPPQTAGEASIFPPGVACQIMAPVVALSASTEPAKPTARMLPVSAAADDRPEAAAVLHFGRRGDARVAEEDGRARSVDVADHRRGEDTPRLSGRRGDRQGEGALNGPGGRVERLQRPAIVLEVHSVA